MAINLDALAIQIIVNAIVLGPVLWLAGRALVGKDKAKFSDALWIAVLGTVIVGVFGFFFTGLIAQIVVLVIWLALIKHFFDCGWGYALLIAILGVIILVVIAFILVLIGLTTLTQMLPYTV